MPRIGSRRLRSPSRFRSRWLRPAVLVIACAACAGAAASEWTVVPGSGSVRMWATKQGAWFDGTFGDFAATIDFDPATPERGSIVGVVRTGSIETEDPQNANFVRAYLNVEEFPEARFESVTVSSSDQGFSAVGELSLNGLTRPVTLDFTFTGTENPGSPEHARFLGLLTIDRFEFDVAREIDVNQAGAEVTVQVELDLMR